MTDLWAGRRAPITLLGGALGSGKTTLLNRVLSEGDGRRIVVLVNDVGDIAVDAALIASATDDVIELTNGCVCCSMTDGLGLALEDLRQMAHAPDQVIIELSGVAEPTRVAPWTGTPGFRLDGIVVCVDAERIESQLTDRWMADTVRAQLRAADLVVLTKTDLVGHRPSLGDLTEAPVLDGRKLSIDALLAVDRADATSTDSEVFDDSASRLPSDWTVVSVPANASVDIEEFRRRLSQLPESVIRIKGFVSGGDGAAWLVQGVGTRRTAQRIDTAPTLGVVGIATPDLSFDALRSALSSLFV